MTSLERNFTVVFARAFAPILRWPSYTLPQPEGGHPSDTFTLRTSVNQFPFDPYPAPLIQALRNVGLSAPWFLLPVVSANHMR